MIFPAMKQLNILKLGRMCTWFLEIAFVWEVGMCVCVCVCVCMCVCVCPPLGY